MNSLRISGIAAAFLAIGFAGGIALDDFDLGDAFERDDALRFRLPVVGFSEAVHAHAWSMPLKLSLLVACACAAFIAIRKLRSSRRLVSRSAPREMALGESRSIERTLAHFSSRPWQDAPRLLLKNPYGCELAGLGIAARVDLAIEASLRHSRVIGVLHFRACAPAVPASEIAAVLRANIRPTDGIHIVGDQDIFVFLSLISRKEKMEKIARRLAACVDAIHPAAATKSCMPGCAMYPIDGYGADELMQAAQTRSATSPRRDEADWFALRREISSLPHLTG